MNRSPLRAFLLIPLVLACFALSPQARAVCQEGCLTNQNTVLGDDALINNTGDSNTAIGFNALFSNTTGFDNTAIGFEALYSNTTGTSNTANGFDALFSNTAGNFNTANGYLALNLNTAGSFNTANGVDALDHNTIGSFNTATGGNALSFNATGNSNTANGFFALNLNTTGRRNTASGFFALDSNTTGINNTADGANALLSNTTGSNNIAVGLRAGQNLTTGDDNIDIGNAGVRDESDTIRIGTVGTHTNTFIAGISVSAIAGGAVVVNNKGRLGVASSSQRFKDEIKPMEKSSEAVLALRPVTFRYKPEVDPERAPQFGLVAEEVEKVNPDLVTRDDQGKPYSVRYDAVNAMLLNEFLKEHHTVQELKFAVAKQEATAAHQQKQIEALTAGLQKVSAQIELSKPASRTVLNNQ